MRISLAALSMGLMLLAFPAWADCPKNTNNFSRNFSLEPDIGFGNNYSKSLKKNFKKYGVCKVTTDDGHPARLGRKSIRFEVKKGDCGWLDPGRWNDCDRDRSRHELSGQKHRDGEYWYTWSIYLPEDFKVVFPTKLAIGQFHQDKGHVVWMFQNVSGGYYVDRQLTGITEHMKKILDHDQMIGQWNDIIVNAHWTHEDKGFFKVWVNGDLAFAHAGRTKSKGKKVYQKFGVYRSFLSRYQKRFKAGVPGQVVYYDEVRTARTCEKLRLGDLGYRCDVLTTQSLD